jgi:adenylylsulfate kinase
VTLWLTGLSGSGKSTLATALADRLRALGRKAEVLDGDRMRQSLSKELGFSQADRQANVERIGVVAEILARNGIIAIVPVIAPYRAGREAVRERHRASRTPYLEVHVSTPVAVCADRDVKGLYRMQATGALHGLSGIDAPYEEPSAPDERIDTSTVPLDAAMQRLLDLLAEHRLL